MSPVQDGALAFFACARRWDVRVCAGAASAISGARARNPRGMRVQHPACRLCPPTHAVKRPNPLRSFRPTKGTLLAPFACVRWEGLRKHSALFPQVYFALCFAGY